VVKVARRIEWKQFWLRLVGRKRWVALAGIVVRVKFVWHIVGDHR
jgi:hypothetical protein